MPRVHCGGLEKRGRRPRHSCGKDQGALPAAKAKSVQKPAAAGEGGKASTAKAVAKPGAASQRAKPDLMVVTDHVLDRFESRATRIVHSLDRLRPRLQYDRSS